MLGSWLQPLPRAAVSTWGANQQTATLSLCVCLSQTQKEKESSSSSPGHPESRGALSWRRNVSAAAPVPPKPHGRQGDPCGGLPHPRHPGDCTPSPKALPSQVVVIKARLRHDRPRQEPRSINKHLAMPPHHTGAATTKANPTTTEATCTVHCVPRTCKSNPHNKPVSPLLSLPYCGNRRSRETPRLAERCGVTTRPRQPSLAVPYRSSLHCAPRAPAQ